MSVLAIGAHPDDIEIGAGGLLLSLAAAQPGVHAYYLVLSGTPDRRREAAEAARSFLPGAQLRADLRALPDGGFPGAWAEVKRALEEVAAGYQPDVVIAPSQHDAHQDHRTIAEIVPTVFRDALYLAYEIPKWDGDLGRGQPSVYFPIPAEIARKKVELLNECFPSQRSRDWWDEEVFLGLARLRGMECRAQYAEAFGCSKLLVLPVPAAPPGASRQLAQDLAARADGNGALVPTTADWGTGEWAGPGPRAVPDIQLS